MLSATIYRARLATYRRVLNERSTGRLDEGLHLSHSGQMCALELASVVKGLPWTDLPSQVGMPDLRPLNDAAWSSGVARTKHMLPILAAYHEWATWPITWRRQVVERVVVGLASRVMPLAMRAHGAHESAKRAERIHTLEQAIDTHHNMWAETFSGWPTITSWARALNTQSEEMSLEYVLHAAALVAQAVSETRGLRDIESDAVLAAACRVWRQAVTIEQEEE